jgi:hypothetical protein
MSGQAMTWADIWLSPFAPEAEHLSGPDRWISLPAHTAEKLIEIIILRLKKPADALWIKSFEFSTEIYAIPDHLPDDLHAGKPVVMAIVSGLPFADLKRALYDLKTPTEKQGNAA